MWRITPKRNGWIVITKTDRKQTHKNVFAKKADAQAHYDSLYNKLSVEKPSTQKIVDAYEKFVKDRQAVAAKSTLALTIKGLSGHVSDLKLRVKPYMPNVLLSDFKYPIMKQFLIDCHAAGHKYKRLQRTVKHLKTFLRVMQALGNNPCTDMLAFDINTVHEIKPADHNEVYEQPVEVIDEETVKKILIDLNANKDKDYKSAISFAVVCTLFLFGLRRSEMMALKRHHVNTRDGVLSIKGVYLPAEGGYLRRTKNRGSFRDIDMDENGTKFFYWYLNWLEKNMPHSNWLFPSSRGSNPLSSKSLSNIMWSIYERMGLATLEWKENNNYCVVKKSPFKYAPTKTFRHRLATMLIDAMHYEKGLTANYVKSVVGHTRFTTTQDRYGNHNRKVVKAKTNAKSRVLGTATLQIN